MIVISLIISRYAFITQSIATSYLHTNAINNAQLSLDPDILKMSSSLVRQATASYLRDDPTLAGLSYVLYISLGDLAIQLTFVFLI